MTFSSVDPYLFFDSTLIGHQCWLVEYPLGSGNKSIVVAGGSSVILFPTGSAPSTGVHKTTEIYNVANDAWHPGTKTIKRL